MTEKNLFSETQKFRQWWLWLIFVGIEGLMGFSIITQIIYGKSFSDSKWENLLIGFFVVLAVCILFFILRLETRISDNGIYVRFFPVQLKFRHYKWEDIDQIYLREYSPIVEYGGWGIRYSLFGKGKAFNVSGKMGLQLGFKNGRKVLIGTDKPEDMAQNLTAMGR
ncbi:hypothetical protein [Fluviicola sp.]|uniref:hypothetical protein n=1 Tax=Fluviicola sp. TaxID=1917219 RepID=UPI00282156DE|nr:hypothetical protein [Fluviicola sp.]MDR0802933.1 hypothetical protein [Fluviicola sp.]